MHEYAVYLLTSTAVSVYLHPGIHIHSVNVFMFSIHTLVLLPVVEGIEFPEEMGSSAIWCKGYIA